MDKRGCRRLKLGLLVTIFLTSSHLLADETLKPTEVSSTPIDELGTKRTTRPTQSYDESQIQSELRPYNDGLNSIPGVQARLNGSPTISIRGSQSSSRTLVLTEGAPLNFSDGLGFNPIFIASENLTQVVLLRGSASSLFGHDAVSGALDFQTEKFKSEKFYLGYGSFNTTQVFAGAPLTLGSTDLQMTAYQTHSDGNYPYSAPNFPPGTRIQNNSETLRATVSASQTKSDFIKWNTYNLVARQIGATPGSLSFATPNGFNNWAELSHFGISFNLGDEFKIGSRTTYKYSHQNYLNPTSISDSQSFKEGLSLAKKIGNHEVEVFDDFYYEQYYSDSLGSGQPTDTLNEPGVSDLYSFSDHFTIQPAIRFSNESGGIVPSLGLTETTDSQWKFFANYTEGYHPPSITQKYAQTPQFIPNPNLTAEHSTETDLGIEKPFDNVLTAHLELFNRDIYNLITNQNLPNFSSTPINAGHARAQGAELSFESGEIIPIKSGMSVSYLNNVFVDSGNPVPLSPRVQASAHVTKNIKRVSLTAQDTYWSDYYDQSFTTGGLVNLNSWNTFDLFIDTQIYKSISVRVAVLNIFDQSRELTLDYPEPQRSYSVMLQGYL